MESSVQTGKSTLYLPMLYFINNFLFQVLWMLFNWHGEMSTAYKRYWVKKNQPETNKKRNFGLEALKITFLHYGPHWGCWIIFSLLITWTVSLHTVLSVFLAFVISMEVLQFYLYPSRHFKFIENWMELFIILLSKYFRVRWVMEF